MLQLHNNFWQLQSDHMEYLDQEMYKMYQLLPKQLKMAKWNSLLGKVILYYVPN